MGGSGEGRGGGGKSVGGGGGLFCVAGLLEYMNVNVITSDIIPLTMTQEGLGGGGCGLLFG